MMNPATDKPLWTPRTEQLANCAMSAFAAKARALSGLPIATYGDLHDWSIQSPVAFWRLVREFCGVVVDKGPRGLIGNGSMQHARWFPDARLNFAENLLKPYGNPTALVFRGEDKIKQTMGRDELRVEVARFAAALRTAGVEQGDRVAAWMPNVPATVIAMLAAASIGAVFTSASPDFGVQGVIDRFGQTEPKVLVSVDGYGGKAIDIRLKLVALMQQLPSVRRLVVVPYLATGSEPDLAGIRDAQS